MKRLCDLAMCLGHESCHKTKPSSLYSGRELNLYLQLLGMGYGTESRQGITIEPNALNDDKDYLVCANLKKYIVDSGKTRKRKSAILDSQARTPTVTTDKTTLRVVFDFEDGREEYKEVTYDDAVEEDKERSNRVGHRTNFPKQVLSFNFRKPFGKITYREKHRRSQFLVKEIIANCVEQKKWKVRALISRGKYTTCKADSCGVGYGSIQYF